MNRPIIQITRTLLTLRIPNISGGLRREGGGGRKGGGRERKEEREEERERER